VWSNAKARGGNCTHANSDFSIISLVVWGQNKYLGAGLGLEHALDAVHSQQNRRRDLENVLELIDVQLHIHAIIRN
jgi:hypothetical protein